MTQTNGAHHRKKFQTGQSRKIFLLSKGTSATTEKRMIRDQIKKTRFREALIRLIDGSGLSIADVAKRADVSREKLYKLHQRKIEVTGVDDAMRLAAFFGTTVEAMSGADQDPLMARALQLLAGLPDEERQMILAQLEGLARRGR